jgi:hypothetical protein
MDRIQPNRMSISENMTIYLMMSISCIFFPKLRKQLKLKPARVGASGVRLGCAGPCMGGRGLLRGRLVARHNRTGRAREACYAGVRHRSAIGGRQGVGTGGRRLRGRSAAGATGGSGLVEVEDNCLVEVEDIWTKGM